MGMSILITVLVALGLLAYVVAAFVREAPDEDTKKASTAVAWLRARRDSANTLTPLLLAVIWMMYGLLHLIRPELAYEQMPERMDWTREPLWAASGAFEILIGLLVLDLRWRRWALLAQLLMLIALTPFVVFLLADDCAMQSLLPGLPVPLGRVVVVFHNVLLFVWTYQAYRDERQRLPEVQSASQSVARSANDASPSVARPDTKQSARTFRRSAVLIVAFVMLAANVAGFAAIAAAPWYSGLPSMWAMGALATGALIGFIFGVPRWVPVKGTAEASRKPYTPNTNIEKLSDWLTKILVGVGLVELHQLGPTLMKTSGVLAQGLTLPGNRAAAPHEAEAFAAGLLGYFAVAGVIQGFLLTRMFIAWAWQEAERESNA